MKLKLSLFWKFSISIIFIVIIFGSVNAYLIQENITKSLEEEIKSRGELIAKSVAIEASYKLLYEDLLGIQNFILYQKTLDPSIEYIFILDENNKLVVHTFEEKFPFLLVNANKLPKNNVMNIEILKIPTISKNRYMDIAYPILEGQLGTVRVGINEELIDSKISNLVNIFLIMVAIFLIIGIIGAFIFSKFITEPILIIQQTADSILSSGKDSLEVKEIKIREKFYGKMKNIIRVEDEIDVLADKFNKMLKRLNDAYTNLQKTQNELLQSEKLATVGRLSAGIAHEINNPISGILNCLRRIKEKPDDKKQFIKYLNLIESAINKIEIVVSSLLSFSRKSKTVHSEVDIKEIIDSSLILLGYRLEKNQIVLEKKYQPGLPNVSGNRIELEQLIINLLINSIDAIEEFFELDSGIEKKIIINSYSQSDYVIIKIIDQGIGIKKEDLTKIMDPFFTTKPVGKGTGLGLSISYNILKSHNGHFEIKSEFKKGTKVLIKLPVLKNE